MKKPVKKQNKLPVVVVVLILLAGVLVFNYQKVSTDKQQSQTTQDQTKTFQSSSVMKFQISVPTSHEITEKFGSATISTPNGNILIGQNGTNFDNLKNYISNSNNNLEDRIKNKKELKINGLDVVSGVIENRKTYFIYSDFRVYILSTDSESLFTDLDQIAQSFRYMP